MRGDSSCDVRAVPDITPGPLGICIDVSVARNWPRIQQSNTGHESQTGLRSWVFSSHLEFNEPTDMITALERSAEMAAHTAQATCAGSIVIAVPGPIELTGT